MTGGVQSLFGGAIADSAAAEPSQAIVRPFRHSDIPAVAALRQPAFRNTERKSVADLSAYLDRIFFGSRFHSDDFHSLVYEDSGVVTGFLGVIPRIMEIRGRELRVAVATQLMSAPSNRGLAGRRLLRALFEGPQDVTFADIGNDAARLIHESLGGRTSIAYSLTWSFPTRPMRAFVTRHVRSARSRVGAYVLRPVWSAIDELLVRARRRSSLKSSGDYVEAIDLAFNLHELEPLLSRWALRPRYDRATLAWLLAAIKEKNGCADLQQCSVRDAKGRLLGWFVYCRNSGGVSQVVQLVAKKGGAERVIAKLFDHALANGVVELTGRLDPHMLGPLASAGCTFGHQGNWMLVQSRHADVLDAIERHEAFVSRLEGEWWLSF